MVLVIDGHPDPDSLCAGLAGAAVEGASDAGAPAERLDLRDLAFDPILRRGYRGEQPLEPDLRAATELLLAARHLVLVYPTWWGGTPALLKGFFDRVLLPGTAFAFTGAGRWDKLLAGRSARVVTTLDWPVWAYHLVQGAPGRKAVGRATLGFCGVHPITWTELSPGSRADEPTRAAWLARVRREVRRDAAALPLPALARPGAPAGALGSAS